ncbi:MAG: thiamine phosphate synthase [Cyanobacteria bacterium RUI128]|nr:thiamine phosphate synthase [Cyanobacteria bacterium RUI128]
MNGKLREQIIQKKIREKHAGLEAVFSGYPSLDEFIDKIASALSGGIEIVQLSGENLSDKDFLDCARKIKQLCEMFNATFIVKNRADIARLSGADSVNLEQEDIDIRNVKEIIGEEILVGLYVNTENDVLLSVKDGADYISINQIFPTPQEPVKNTGLEYAKWVSENTLCPVLLSGNINVNNYQILLNNNFNRFLIDNSLLDTFSPNSVTVNILNCLKDFESY